MRYRSAMGAPRIACVTCRDLPEPDPDEALLLAAIEAAGGHGELAAWDADYDWTSADLCVLRSSWNYYLDRGAFLAWATRVDELTRLHNPLAVIERNTDKRYLAELEARGVPVVPTVFVTPDAPRTLASIREERGWGEVVVKPAVGAASFGSRRVHASDDAEAHLTELLGRGIAMVQPYLPAVETTGERSLIWIDGQLTHAVRKSARFAGADEQVSDSAVPIPDGAEALAAAALATVEQPLLYARVDVVPDETGRLVIMELELTEPSLYLAQHPPALERFAAALVREAAR